VGQQGGSFELTAQNPPEARIAGGFDDVREVGHQQEVPGDEGSDNTPGDPGACSLRDGCQTDHEEWRETHKATHAEGEAAKPVGRRAA